MKILTYAIVLVVALFISCNKEWLDMKSSSTLVVPTSLSDMRQILDNETYIQLRQMILIEAASDDFFYMPTILDNLNPYYLKPYLWNTDGDYSTTTIASEWDNSYKKVFLCNLVLENLVKIDPNEDPEEWRTIKGMALFYRAEAFHDLSQHFAQLYNPATSATDLGIHLQLSTELNVPIKRASVEQTYNQIIRDLEVSIVNLPESTESRYYPSKYAARTLLARIYLSLGDYDNAFHHADTCLQYNSTLLNYMDIDTTSFAPFNLSNPELYYISNIQPLGIYSTGSIDTLLLHSYLPEDRRRPIFFRPKPDGSYGIKSDYTGTGYVFGGSSVNEMLLTRAECYARQGNTTAAFADLNYLLSHRVANFSPLPASTPEESLNIVLQERRKELVGRAVRWLDIKRLNLEKDHAKTLVRDISGMTYTLPPNDSRYSFLIPNYIIQASGITQNPR